MKNGFSFCFPRLAKHTLCNTLALLWLLLSGVVFADTNLSDLFVNGIVTHGNNGSVTFSWNGQLVNGSDSLLYAKSVSNSDWAAYSCISQSVDCTTDKNHNPKSVLTLPDFSTYASTSSDNYATAWDNNDLTLTPGEYNSVTLNSDNHSLTFDSGDKGNNDLYQINTLTLGSNSTVTFGPGRYWIKEFNMNWGVNVNFDLDDGERIVLIIENSFAINSDLNTAGDANHLVIISYDDLRLAEGKTVNGFLYAQDTLTLSSGSTVNGAVAGQTVNLLSSGAKVVYIDAAPDINLETGTAAIQSCSSYIGNATINEVSKDNKNSDSDADFIEVRLLDSSISYDTYKDWSIQICEYNNNSCSTVSLADFAVDTSPWLVAKGSNTVGSYIDIENGTEVILYDADGAQIDYLTINGYSPNPSSCTFVYNTTANEDTNKASPYRAIREPDGTGDWDMPPGNSKKATEGASNNGDDGSATTIDHYEVIHDGSGLTCEEETVTIIACADRDCTETSNEAVTLDLYGNGSKLTSVSSFSGSTSVSFSHTTAETVTLSVDNESITPENSLQCYNGNSNSCNITFANAGFRFLYAGSYQDIANQIAGTTFDKSLQLQAVKDEDGVCTALFSGNVNVSLSQENISPDGTGGLIFAVDDTEIGKYSSSTSILLSFDNDSTATLTDPIYNDAGQIRLHADYNQGGISLTGTSNSFWVSPSYLKVTAQSGGTDINGNTSSSNTTHKAGEDFTLTVTAYNSLGDVTQNYSPGNMQFKLTRTAPLKSYNVNGSLIYAADSAINSAVSDYASFSDVTLTDFYNGVSTYSSAQFSEVGVLKLDIQDSAYGDGAVTINADEINIGRFTPDHFEITAINDGTLAASNGYGFVYTGQTVSDGFTTGALSYSTQPQFTLTAMSADDMTTQNYTDNFMKLTSSSVVRVTPGSDAAQLGTDEANLVNLTANFSDITLTENGAGEVTYQYNSSDNFVYTREANALIAPFAPTIELQVTAITDSDGIKTDNYNEENILTLQPEDEGLDIRFGRQYMENSYGPETAALRVPMQVQYWDGSKFTTNSDDSFTTFAADNCSITDISLAPATTTASGNGSFNEGETQLLTLSAPGEGNTGSVTVECSVSNWLQYDWSNSDGSYDEEPSAEATFGLYRGNDRIIYRREVFE